jgi:hypothetical protein
MIKDILKSFVFLISKIVFYKGHIHFHSCIKKLKFIYIKDILKNNKF